MTQLKTRTETAAEPTDPRSTIHDPRSTTSIPRALYAREALALIPRFLQLVDRNPMRATYGCFDRNYWHYRTADFPSGMFQEYVLPLALVYQHPFPGNRWFQQVRVRELALAGIGFAARSAHRDGSCDDYYPYERALGAAAFSLYACTEAWLVLGMGAEGAAARQTIGFFRRRADWLAEHDESGKLSNHQALAVLALWNVHVLTGEERYARAARRRLERLWSWQSAEGWFPEYEGCDPGYLTLTIGFLAKYHAKSGDPDVLGPLRRALAFARHFQHPDGSFGGEYGSRNTHHFHPHGFELLGRIDSRAACLADGFLKSLAARTRSFSEDDRIAGHLSYDLLQAYLDWRPREVESNLEAKEDEPPVYFPEAGLLVQRARGRLAVVGLRKGGVIRLYEAGRAAGSDSGLVAETADGRTLVMHQVGPRAVDMRADCLTVSGPLVEVRHDLPTPGRMLLFRLGLCTLGRFRRDLVRRLLQKRLILGRREVGMRVTREIRWGPRVEVIDHLELDDPRLHIRRLMASSDATSIYVATSNPYQDSALQPWTDWSAVLERLNRERRVSIRRTLGGQGGCLPRPKARDKENVGLFNQDEFEV